MDKAVLFCPPEEAIDRSLDARAYLNRLEERLSVEKRPYAGAEAEALALPDDAGSAAVLSGLSGLKLESGYMEMELDTVFGPQELLGRLRDGVAPDFPLIAIVDDAYSDYITRSYLKAGASAVVGTSGALFGLLTFRISRWEQLLPYINAFEAG